MVPLSTRKTEQQNHSEFEAMAVEVSEYGKKASETIREETLDMSPIYPWFLPDDLISPSLDVRGDCSSEN